MEGNETLRILACRSPPTLKMDQGSYLSPSIFCWLGGSSVLFLSPLPLNTIQMPLAFPSWLVLINAVTCSRLITWDSLIFPQHLHLGRDHFLCDKTSSAAFKEMTLRWPEVVGSTPCRRPVRVSLSKAPKPETAPEAASSEGA